MHPIFIYIGNRPIYWYGVMMALSFLAGIVHWRLLGRKEGRDPAFGADLAFWIMISGILGARVAYVLANFSEYAAHPLSIIRIDQGGLVYYGGFLGAGVALLIFARVRREKLSSLMDFVITAIPLAHAIGRIGCFMNGCCYGRPGAEPWCFSIPSVDRLARHPVQLYEAAANLALYALLIVVYRRRKIDGHVLATYLLLYPPVRFALEYFRGDERIHPLSLGLNMSQITSLGLFLIGCALWVWQRQKHDHSQSKTA